jgi:hypothetical protein
MLFMHRRKKVVALFEKNVKSELLLLGEPG